MWTCQHGRGVRDGHGGRGTGVPTLLGAANAVVVSSGDDLVDINMDKVALDVVVK